MAILQFKNINKAFGGEYLLKNINFSIDQNDKIALIGLNGCGKTTLIKMILGEEGDDISLDTKKNGEIIKKKGLRIAYLSQYLRLEKSNTIFDEVMGVFSHVEKIKKEIEILNKEIANLDGDILSKKMDKLAKLVSQYEQEEGYDLEYRVKQVLNGIGYKEEDYNLVVENLSGGQKSRVALAKILIKEPELLILDEPTNHLDLIAIEWLESFLKNYNNAFILVSHDRYFLDAVAKKVYEIENKKIFMYKGNVTEFRKQKELRLKTQKRAFEKQQVEIKKTEEFVRKYKAGIKSKQAHGRELLLNRLERIEDPSFVIEMMKLKFEIDHPSGEKVLEVRNLKKSYGRLDLFWNINFDVFRGDRIGIIGKNGIGKSTLLKIINKIELQDEGRIKYGNKLKIGYYDQNHKELVEENTIYDELRETKPMSEEETRRMAARFLFKDEDILKKIKNLSGGEKSRVAFLKLILKKPNFLIIDEPTNHLDIYSREVLENSLKDYEGTLITVSHDRYFLENVANKIYIMENQKINIFDGNYDAYKKQIKEKNLKKNNEENIFSYEEQKRIKNRMKFLEKEQQKLEEIIENLEREKKELDKKYKEAGLRNEYEKLVEINKMINKKDEEIIDKMDIWEKNILELEEMRRKQDV